MATAGRIWNRGQPTGEIDMFLEGLKQFAARLVNWIPPSPGPSEDPYVGVREPRKRGPAGRTSSVAVKEPEPDQSVDAAGRSWRT